MENNPTPETGQTVEMSCWNSTIPFFVDSSRERDEDIPFWVAANGFAVTMVILGVVGVLGNGLSLYVFSRREMANSPINVFLGALSFIDLCICLVVSPSVQYAVYS